MASETGQRRRWGRKRDKNEDQDASTTSGVHGESSSQSGGAISSGGLHLLKNSSEFSDGTTDSHVVENTAGRHIEEGFLTAQPRKESEMQRVMSTQGIGPKGKRWVSSHHDDSLASRGADGSSSTTSFLTLFRDHAFCLMSLMCAPDDMRLFNGLLSELEFKEAWMSGGSKFARPAVIGSQEVWNRSACYRECVRKLVTEFRLSNPIWTLTNMYRDAEDCARGHQDRHVRGVNFTCGASFGETRSLELWTCEEQERMKGHDKGYDKQSGAEHGIPRLAVDMQSLPRKFTFPQKNGDIFAFSEFVNTNYYHGVPRENRVCGPRVSLIIWGQRRGNTKTWDYEEAWKKDPDGYEVHIAESPVFAHHLKEGKKERILNFYTRRQPPPTI